MHLLFQINQNQNQNDKSPTSQNRSNASSPEEWKVRSHHLNFKIIFNILPFIFQVVGTKESKKEVKKPLSFSDMAKKPGVPQPIIKRIPFPEKTIAQTNRPHCYFKVSLIC